MHKTSNKHVILCYARSICVVHVDHRSGSRVLDLDLGRELREAVYVRCTFHYARKRRVTCVERVLRR